MRRHVSFLSCAFALVLVVGACGGGKNHAKKSDGSTTGSLGSEALVKPGGPIGPVRSVRKTDQSLVWPLGGVFAYSGGAQYAIDSINTAPVVQLDETRAGS